METFTPSFRALKLLKTLRRFKLITMTDKPTFNHEYEYVDFALSALQRRFSTFFEEFWDELEGISEGLPKSSFKSESIRDMGNHAFKAGHMFEAHKLYTLSIAFAKTGSKELALAYGNRSAVLFGKQFYKECLEDIKRAFENNYPEEKKAKLLERQEKATELLSNQKKVTFHARVPTVKNKNVNMPSASEAIRIDKNDEFGRHIVATRTINAGEILLVEKPYSQYVFPEVRTIYCSECLELCYNMIPCEKCSGALYCSKTCKRKAYVDYHRYECDILRHFGYDIIGWNATRITLKGIKEYDNIDNEDKNPNEYRSGRYKEISELLPNKDIDLEDTISKLTTAASSAAKVFYALKKYSDIFSVFDVENKETILKTLLFRDACIDLYNSALVVSECDWELENTIGRTIYSTMSMFNHACSENVGQYFFGSVVVLRAKKIIKKGEQCFINYGVSPVFNTKTKRQEFIQGSYHFTCKCQGCVENWPKLDTPSDRTKHFLRDLNNVFKNVSSNKNIDKYRKNALLQKSLGIAKKTEIEAPFMTYMYLKNIFDCCMGGNAHTYYS